MRKQNFSSKDREQLEDVGQMSIFDMLNAGIDPDEVVLKAEAEVEDAKLTELKASAQEMPDSPIGLKTEGNNLEIKEYGEEDQLDQLLTEALNEAIDDNESLSSDKVEINAVEINEEELAKTLNQGFNNETEVEEHVSIDCEYYTLDDFAGSEPDFDDRLIAFDTSLSVDDPKFVVAVQRSDYSSITEFKADFAGQGGLNENLIIAFPLKADAEPEKVIAMYEKKVSQSHKVDKKNADKEARKIADLEESGDVSEDILDESEETPKKRGRKPKV